MNKELEVKLKDFYKLQREIDELTDVQRQIKKDLEELIIKENMVNKKFSVGDRMICYKKSESTQSLTQQYLVSCFEHYFRDDPEEAEALMRYILDGRSKKSQYALEVRKKPKPKESKKGSAPSNSNAVEDDAEDSSEKN